MLSCVCVFVRVVAYVFVCLACDFVFDVVCLVFFCVVLVYVFVWGSF